MTVGGSAVGSSCSNKSTSTSSTPWTNIANSLSTFLGNTLKGIGCGAGTAKTIDDLTASTRQSTKSGTADIKSAFGASGMSQSTDMMKAISDFNVKQTTALNTQIDQVEQQGIQDQLAALQEII